VISADSDYSFEEQQFLAIFQKRNVSSTKYEQLLKLFKQVKLILENSDD